MNDLRDWKGAADRLGVKVGWLRSQITHQSVIKTTFLLYVMANGAISAG
jgi:hypothetical protein